MRLSLQNAPLNKHGDETKCCHKSKFENKTLWEKKCMLVLNTQLNMIKFNTGAYLVVSVTSKLCLKKKNRFAEWDFFLFFSLLSFIIHSKSQ